MKISKKLNLVIPIQIDDNVTFYVHSTPISSQVFESNYMLIAKTFAAIYAGGYGVVAGPRIAANLMHDVAKDLGLVVECEALQSEIIQRTNILSPGQSGWEMTPFHDFSTRQDTDPDLISEVRSALTFFTVASRMHRREQVKEVLENATELWGGRIESLSCSELMSSLQTSTVTAPSEAKKPESQEIY